MARERLAFSLEAGAVERRKHIPDQVLVDLDEADLIGRAVDDESLDAELAESEKR